MYSVPPSTLVGRLAFHWYLRLARLTIAVSEKRRAERTRSSGSASTADQSAASAARLRREKKPSTESTAISAWLRRHIGRLRSKRSVGYQRSAGISMLSTTSPGMASRLIRLDDVGDESEVCTGSSPT